MADKSMLILNVGRREKSYTNFMERMTENPGSQGEVLSRWTA